MALVTQKSSKFSYYSREYVPLAATGLVLPDKFFIH